jgi:homoserine O-acetyltransferase
MTSPPTWIRPCDQQRDDLADVRARWTPDCQVGWWDQFIGPDRALDTDQFWIICVNYLGGCYGSSGPSSPGPDGTPYGSSFPHVSISDIVDSQVELLKHLEIRQLHAVVGPSLGGLMALSLATRYPDMVRNVIPVAAGLTVTPLQRIHNLEQIFAIESDPNFEGGDYYDGSPPNHGLVLARMIGHKTYVSLRTMENRARMGVGNHDDELAWYEPPHELESYMLHQGRKLTSRFDPNSYLRLVDAWQRFDLVGQACVSNMLDAFSRCKSQRYLLFTIDSDVCFYPDEQTEMASVLKLSGINMMRITVHSDQGHDSFLLEPELFSPQLSYALSRSRSPAN